MACEPEPVVEAGTRPALSFLPVIWTYIYKRSADGKDWLFECSVPGQKDALDVIARKMQTYTKQKSYCFLTTTGSTLPGGFY